MALTTPAAPNILTRQRMAPLAMGLSGITGRATVPALDILAVRDGLQVGWVNAKRVAAEVVDRQTCWYKADPPFVGVAMRQPEPTIEVELPVPPLAAT